MRGARLAEWEADWVFDILVSECGLRDDEDDRADFTRHHSKEEPPGEWRIGGALGFGGKFYTSFNSYDGRTLRVDYYPEDKSAERDEMVRRTNERLTQLPRSDPNSVRVGTPRRKRPSNLAERHVA